MAAELCRGGQQPGLYERLDEDDEAASVAAGGGDALAGYHGVAPGLRELRKAIGPAGGDTVGGGGVHHTHRGVFDHGDGLAARGVRQAEDGQVTGVERAAPGLRVLPSFTGEGDELQVGAALQSGMYAQAGRTGAAVYEYLCHAVTCFKYSICAAMFAGEAPPFEVRFATQAAMEMSS